MERSNPVVDQQTKFWRLRRAELFADLGDNDVKELSALCEIRVVDRSMPVYDVGEASDQLFVLETGSVKIARVGDDGREVSIGVLGPGEVFGELALAGETTREDTVRVIEDAVVCGFERGGFETFLGRHPALALRFTRLIGERLRQVEMRIQDILFKDVRTRLAHTMAGLATKFGEDTPDGRRICLRLTQSELAQLIGSTRETTSTIFNEFRRDGLVGNDGHHIIVHDLDRLASY